MTQEKPKASAFDLTLDLKTLLQVGALIGAIIAGYYKFEDRVEAVVMKVDHIEKQTTRMEHYLSSNDPQYYKKTHENGDSDEK